MKPSLAFAVGVAVALGAASLGAAQPLRPSRIVLQDLDLRRAADRQVLEQRIEAAARHSCAGYTPAGTKIARPAICMAAVREEALAKLPDSVRQEVQLAAGASPSAR